jgi:hypothetical protein
MLSAQQATMQAAARCSACGSADHDREAHFDAAKARQCSAAHRAAGNDGLARFWDHAAELIDKRAGAGL